MVHMNAFRILGDVSHATSKCILIWAIHSNKSAEGVSLITQALYAAVFVTRYLDLFTTPPAFSYWNFVLKIFYLLSSFYVILLMLRIFPRTRERERAWKLGGYALAAAVILAPILTPIFEGKQSFRPLKILRTFSIILESVCVLPQLVLLRQTTVPTVIDSYYLLTLGSYRFFYLLNWIVRALPPERHFDFIDVFFGIIQTLLYFDFFWVYYTRQRVKLRGGGVVDSDDLRRGWFLKRIFGTRPSDHDDEETVFDEEQAPHERLGRTRTHPKWGARGISITADDDLFDRPQTTKFPSDLARDHERTGILNTDLGVDDDDNDEVRENVTPQTNGAHSNGIHTNGVSNGDEWRDSRRQ
ncbi:hypothetical protein L228DRAFT_228470 [Xylona heveae TC161]|uniref:ER lumen protein retaining receptor n=1 Tax=Xylona heveae (strain CBS 132557 / TC161) TaxID=1328760 RepID=A0A165I6X9_XYLHT|nr:hypothetical protein L228DRAFT_228470 [Xylona heveae TC161]KZF24479.1 hypothetical protein L228DRAFT_228470 [Xylona heveae TC161]